MANFPKLLSNWSLAAGLEINPAGTGIRLALQSFFDDFNDGSLNAAFTAYTGGGGSVVEASNKLAIISSSSARHAMIEYNAGLDLTLENHIEFKFAVGATSTTIMSLMNPGQSFPTTGSSVSTGEWMQFFNAGTALFMTGQTGGGVSVGQTSFTIVLGTSYIAKFWITSTHILYELWNAADTIILASGVVDLSLTLKSSDSPQLTFGDSKTDRWTCDIELFDLLIEAGYLSTSPVATMGNVSLTAGTIINGVGNELVDLEGSSTVQAAYNPNDDGWTAPFASIAAMNADLLSNPVTITDTVNSFDVRFTFNSDGVEQAEAFVSEGPNLSGFGAVCDFPSESDVRLNVDYDNANLTGSAAIPGASDVRDGVAVDATTGTYEPANEADVLLNVQYGANGTEFTGSLPPAVCDFPAETDVRLNVDYDNANLTGTAAIPGANDVRENVPTDDTVGNYVPAQEGNHALGDSYGSNGTEFTGTKALTPFNLPVEVILEDSEILVFEGCE